LNKDLSSLTQASGNYNVTYYKCEWNIDPANYYISGKVTPYFIITAATDNIVFDLSTALTVDSVIVRKRKLSFSQASNETLTIQLPKAYKKGKRDSVAIYYKGVPVGSGFGSFIQSTTYGTPVLWTLSEPYGAGIGGLVVTALMIKLIALIFLLQSGAYKTSSNGVFNQCFAKRWKKLPRNYKHRLSHSKLPGGNCSY
jgi:hypothetical protein